MATTLALTAVTIAAALALLLRAPGARAGAMGVALVGAPILLATQPDVWDSGPMRQLRDGPGGILLLLAAAAVGVLVLVAAAAFLRRRPGWIPLLVAAALPFRIPIDVGGGQPVNLLVPLYLVTGAAALAWVWDRAAGVRDADGHPGEPPVDPRPVAADVLLLLFVVLYAVQSAWSDDQAKAVEQVAFFYVPFALLYVVLRTTRWTTALAGRCLAVATGVALVLGAVGFYEYATKTVLLNPKVIASNQIEDAFRVNSLFFDPNIYGRFLVLVMLGLTAWMLWSARGRTIWLTGAALAILWAALVLTYSQTSFLALLVGLAVLGGMRFGPWKAFGALVAVVAVGAVLVLAAPGALNLKGLNQDGLDGATSGRVALTGGGIGIFADHPFFGVGSGGFSKAYREAEHSGERKAVDASHTIPITIAAEQGIVGLGVYVLLIVLVLRRLLRDAESAAARAGIAAMAIALVAHTMGYAAFLEDPVLWVLLAAGGALAGGAAAAAGVRRRSPDAPRSATAAAP
ncbi:O-antigen ligase family protein [Patulibacter defluvii]|uniref:O-antigen ligase family protein n=1 Tax=Patulibacter defluvii TaxID=3095358 RepID=UPI002A766114|nr:O-antigen ligase family protein [Patulibacter sp. DM4]